MSFKAQAYITSRPSTAWKLSGLFWSGLGQVPPSLKLPTVVEGKQLGRLAKFVFRQTRRFDFVRGARYQVQADLVPRTCCSSPRSGMSTGLEKRRVGHCAHLERASEQTSFSGILHQDWDRDGGDFMPFLIERNFLILSNGGHMDCRTKSFPIFWKRHLDVAREKTSSMYLARCCRVLRMPTTTLYTAHILPA